MADIAHISGLVASKLMCSPFEFCDIVTSTTHKSLRGGRSGIIFMRKKYEDAINFAVFPCLNGGPHNANIAAIAVQMKEVQSEEFKAYCKQIIANARAVAEALKSKGEKMITDGTDNHLIMWDVRQHELTGSKMEKILEKMRITTNKNSVVGDKNYVNPGGIRLGTPAMTTRGMVEKDMVKIVDYLMAAVKIAKEIQEKVGKKLVDFVAALDEHEELKKLSEDVKGFASSFSIPGV